MVTISERFKIRPVKSRIVGLYFFTFTTKQHAVVSIQLNTVTCHRYRDNVTAPFFTSVRCLFFILNLSI